MKLTALITGGARLACALAGCGDDGKKSSKTDSASAALQMCDRQVHRYEAARILTGAAIIAGRQSAEGNSALALFGGLVVGMLVNGIDFVALKDFDVGFEDGRYTFATGNDELGFRLYFATDFGDFHAGDPIPYNVFDVESYVKKVDVHVGGSLAHPDVSYDVEPGPLADLVEGDVDISGRDPRTLKIKLALHTEAVGFAFDSVQRDTFEVPIAELLGLVTGKWDYQVHMNSTPVSLADLPERLAHDGYGVSLAGSSVKTEYWLGDEQVQQTAVTFDSAEFRIITGPGGDTDGYWEGPYDGVHDTWFEDFGGTSTAHLYEHGQASTRNENYTEYYCDAGHTQLWGRAVHNADLTGGTLTLADGETLDYSLGEVQTDDQRAGDDPTD